MLYAFRSILGSFIDFVYPPLCLVCESLLRDGRRQVCDTCWRSMALARDHPGLIDEVRHKLGEDVDDVRAAFVFQKTGPLQKLVHALKYEKMEDVGLLLGERVGEELKEWGDRPDLLIPVPLHRAKERERGYNQAELVARGCASQAGGRVETRCLRRVRNTRTQTKLSIEERRLNVADVFEVAPAFSRMVAGADVLIVDDVITTGATIGACGRALRAAGAARVVAGAVALADHAA